MLTTKSINFKTLKLLNLKWVKNEMVGYAHGTTICWYLLNNNMYVSISIRSECGSTTRWYNINIYFSFSNVSVGERTCQAESLAGCQNPTWFI
jgi:hypothetical protein